MSDGSTTWNFQYGADGLRTSRTNGTKTYSYVYNGGTLNPLRYRGYVYDSETGFYYLQSRYCDPETIRFLNADAFTATRQGLLGNNMFAYCLNNPVRNHDLQGLALEEAFNDEPIFGKSPSDDVTTGVNALGLAFGLGITCIVANKPPRKTRESSCQKEDDNGYRAHYEWAHA